jgi:hypothetical protein
MRALALAAALVAIAGPALPRAAGFSTDSYRDGCTNACGGTYYADADPSIGSGDIPYGFAQLVYDNAPNRSYWAHRNSALIDPARIIGEERAVKRYGLPALRGHPSPWGWYPSGGTMCGGCTAPSTYDYNRNFLPIRAGAPAPRLPCGGEILLRFPGLDASSPALYQWMKAQPCGI